jgi:hypothetical protein
MLFFGAAGGIVVEVEPRKASTREKDSEDILWRFNNLQSISNRDFSIAGMV